MSSCPWSTMICAKVHYYAMIEICWQLWIGSSHIY
ncbi:unnamed protein product [Schistosoma mattheei]|uniref:Uncharacterized protein n=1 Tax=Schistosoma mattheei TaxID=31246 RepID=A0A183PH89_9TREM|nr:unnamed protein product [Schistosoma mattheei]